MSVIRRVGCLLLAAIFILGGMKFQDLSGPTAYTQGAFASTGLTSFLASKGVDIVPIVPTLVLIATALEVLGGVLLILPATEGVGAFLLAVFLVPVTFIMHYPIVNGQMDQHAAVDFFKNIALLGAMFVIMSSRSGKTKTD